MMLTFLQPDNVLSLRMIHIAIVVICSVVKGLLLLAIIVVVLADLGLENGLQILDALWRVFGNDWTLTSREKLKARTAPIAKVDCLRLMTMMVMSLRCTVDAMPILRRRSVNDGVHTTDRLV